MIDNQQYIRLPSEIKKRLGSIKIEQNVFNSSNINFELTTEGFNFWEGVLKNKNYNLFYTKHFKESWKIKPDKFKIFPLKLRKRVAELQILEVGYVTGLSNINPNDNNTFGFNPTLTREGESFWKRVFIYNTSEFSKLVQEFTKCQGHYPPVNIYDLPYPIFVRLLNDTKYLPAFTSSITSVRDLFTNKDHLHEGNDFWEKVIIERKYNLFYHLYPKLKGYYKKTSDESKKKNLPHGRGGSGDRQVRVETEKREIAVGSELTGNTIISSRSEIRIVESPIFGASVL